MHTHPHAHLEIHGPQGEDLLTNDGDFGAPSSSLTAINNQTPGMTNPLIQLITIFISYFLGKISQ